MEELCYFDRFLVKMSFLVYYMASIYEWMNHKQIAMAMIFWVCCKGGALEYWSCTHA